MRILGLAALGALPLQWFVLGTTPAGVLRVPQLAALLFCVCILANYRMTKSGPVARRFQVFIVANVCMYLIWIAMSVIKGRSAVEPQQELVYVAVFLAFSSYFFAVASDPRPHLVRAMRWAAPVTVTAFLIAFVYSANRNGLDAWALVKKSIANGDPNVLQFELFRTSFIGFGYDLQTVRANFRHEIFGGLLLSMYVSSWANAREPTVRRLQRAVYRGAMVLASVLLLLSLSRAVLLAAGVWPCLYVARTILTGRVTARHRMTAVGALLGLGVVAFSGLGSLLWYRFTGETASYSARQDSFGFVLTQIGDSFWTGGAPTSGPTSHNFVLDAWQYAGVFVAIPAIVVFCFVVLLWLSLLTQLRTLPVEMLPVVAALTLPVVRLVTAGGGLMSLVEWLTMAFVAGVIASTNLKLAAPQPAPLPDTRQDLRSRPMSRSKAVTSSR